MARELDKAEFQFPIKGVDRSMPVVKQPPLTCRDLQNVRAATDKGRQSGAKRPGLFKKIANAATGTVNCLQVVQRTVVDASAFKGLYETVNETWASRYLTEAQPSPFTSKGENWFASRGDYVAVYRKADAANGGTDFIPHTNHRTDMTRTPLMFQSRFGYGGDLAKGMVYCAGAPNLSTQRSILAINYPTRNSVVMRGFVKPQARTGMYAGQETDRSTPLPAVNDADAFHKSTTDHIEPTWYGPVVRGSGNYYEYFVAYLACMGENRAQLRIDKVSGSTQTNVATSTTILAISGLKDDTGDLNTSTKITNADLTIELTASSTQLRATVRWPGSMTPDADSITVDNSDFATNDRGGVCFMHSDSAHGCLRHVSELTYQRRLPTYKVLSDENQLIGGTPPLVGSANNQYRLPLNTNLVRAVSAAASISTAAFASGHNGAAYPTVGGVNRGVCADKTAGVVGADNGSGGDANAHHGIYKAPPSSGRYMVDVLPTPGLTADPCTVDGSTSARDSVGFISHLDTSNGNRFIAYLIDRTSGSSGGDDFGANTRMGQLNRVRIYSIQDPGTVSITTLLTQTYAAANGDKRPIYSLDVPLTFDFDGTDFRLMQNGVVLLTIPGSSYVPVGWTNTGVVGAYFPPSSTATAVACDGVRWTQDSSTVTTVTEGTDIVAIGSAGIQQADLAVGTWTTSSATATGTTAAPACAAVNNNKVYIVDGTLSQVLDPINKTVTPWTSRTGGTFPTGCSLLVAWRGRPVLARQLANKQAWYMGKLGDWENFDYASTETAIKAYTGTLGEIGQPKEPITALIPFNDDYLVFGCENSMYIMEGDPGAGGVLLPITDQVGVLNQQCWAFSDTGVLYFLAPGGLYQMQPKTRQYSPVVERRVSEWLERQDRSAFVFTIAYSKIEKGLYIFRTPIGLTQGTEHIFIDLPLEGVFRDAYPATMQPLAVAKLEGGTDANAGFYFIGTDGYVRHHKMGVLSDDGTAIDSWCEIGPLELAEGWLNCMAHEVRAEGVIGSGTLKWKWYGDTSAEEVMASSTVAYDSNTNGTNWALGGGYQYPAGLRITAAAHKIRIYNNTADQSWALERLIVSYEALERRRDQ